MGRRSLAKPLPDESIDSFVLRSSRLGCASPKLLDTLAKDPRVRINPYGKSAAHRAVWHAGYLDGLSADEKDALSYANLYRPFSRPRSQLRTGSPSPFSYEYVTKIDVGEIRDGFAQCPFCTQEDIAKLGFSYWRRSRQVNCNRFCLRHNCWTVSACPACGTPFLNNELPELQCSNCFTDYTAALVGKAHIPDDVQPFAQLSVAATGLLSGRIKQPLDLGRIHAIIEDTVKCRTPGCFNNVARSIRHRLGDTFLKQICMHPAEKPNYGWPATYLARAWHRSNPTIELLLFATFGDAARLDRLWSGNIGENEDESRQPAIHLDNDYLRVLYHSRTWGDAYSVLQREPSAARHHFKCYPGLRKRIQRFRKMRAERTRRSPFRTASS